MKRSTVVASGIAILFSCVVGFSEGTGTKSFSAGPGPDSSVLLAIPAKPKVDIRLLLERTLVDQFLYSDRIRKGTPYAEITGSLLGAPKRNFSIEGTYYLVYDAFAIAIDQPKRNDPTTWKTSGFLYYFQPPVPVEEIQPLIPEKIVAWANEEITTSQFTYRFQGHWLNFWIDKETNEVTLVQAGWDELRR